MQIRKPILLFLIWLLLAVFGGFWVWQSAQKKVSSFSDSATTNIEVSRPQ